MAFCGAAMQIGQSSSLLLGSDLTAAISDAAGQLGQPEFRAASPSFSPAQPPSFAPDQALFGSQLLVGSDQPPSAQRSASDKSPFSSAQLLLTPASDQSPCDDQPEAAAPLAPERPGVGCHSLRPAPQIEPPEDAHPPLGCQVMLSSPHCC